MTSITIKYTSLFLLVLAVGMSASSLSFAQTSNDVLVGTNPNTAPTNPSIPVTVTSGERGTIDFTSITDDFDSFDDLQIIFTVPNEQPFSDFVFTGAARVFDSDTNSYLLTVTSSSVTFDVPSDTSPVVTSFAYTATDRGTNTSGGGNTGAVGSGLESSGVINLTILSSVVINRDELPTPTNPVTYDISNTDDVDDSFITVVDFLKSAYNDTERMRLDLSDADLGNVVLTTNSTDQTIVASLLMGNITFGNFTSETVETRTVYLTAQLDNDRHARSSAASVLRAVFNIQPPPAINTDPLGGMSVTLNIDTSGAAPTGGFLQIPLSDFLSEAYPDSILAGLGLVAADRDDMTASSILVPADTDEFFYTGGLSQGYLTPGLSGSGANYTRTFPITITLDNDNHDRVSTGLTVTFVLSPTPVIEEEPLCIVVIDEAVDFGPLSNGDVSSIETAGNRLTIFNNPGGLDTSSIMISAGNWINSTNFVAMNAEQTTWSTNRTALPDDRTAFTDISTVVPDSALTSGGLDNRLRIFLQLTVDLIDVSFRGLATQQVTVSSVCPSL